MEKERKKALMEKQRKINRKSVRKILRMRLREGVKQTPTQRGNDGREKEQAKKTQGGRE